MLIIEKIEGDIIVIEDGDKHFNISKSQITGGFKEGDVLTSLENGCYQTDETATQRRRSHILSLEKDLWE